MAGDEIRLEGMIFFGRHGVNEEETRLGQRFGVDLAIRANLEAAINSDEVADTISYAALYKLVRDEVEGRPSKLLEHLAGRILRRVLESDVRISSAKVHVTKQQPPISGSVGVTASVFIERDRSWKPDGT
jgi:dihydroneopterin aldolase